MDKLLEYLALAAGGIAIYFVAENNLPNIKRAVSNISPEISRYIPVSTTAPAPDVSRFYCPKGMYLDQTDGIYRCHDAHGTRELRSPSGGTPLEAAFYDYDFIPGRPGIANPGQPGDNEPGQCINCTIPGQPGIGGQPGAPGIGYDQPNMTQPLVQPDINKEIESQIPKHKKHHKKKLAEIPDDHQIHNQVECSDSLKCDATCYRDGKLYKVLCSETEKKKKTTTHRHTTTPRQPPSLTVPPNFPSAVTVTPPSPSPSPPLTPGGIANPIDETPYPEDQQQQDVTQPVTDEGPEQDIGPLVREPIRQPEIGPITKEPTRQPQIGPITKEPHRQPQIGQPISTPPGNAVAKSNPTLNKGFTNGCGRSQNRDPYISCRAGIGTGKNGEKTPESGNQTRSVESLLSDKNHFYVIYDFNIDTSAHTVSGHPKDVEITGGYRGSSHSDPAVGVTIGIKPDGTPFCKKEDESRQSWPTICEGNCGGVSKVPNLGKSFSLIWAADKDNGTATYRGYCRTGGKEYLIAKINPGIDFTTQNTYIRGRTNQLGNICPTGYLYNGSYVSSTKSFYYHGPEGFMLEGDGYF